MTSDKFMMFDNILVNQKANPIFLIVHQSQNTDRAGSNIEKLFHEFRTSKGKAGAAYLFGQPRCLEFFMTGHHEKVEICFLSIAQKQIFAYFDIQVLIDIMTGLDGSGSVMIQSAVGNLKLVQ